MNAIRNVYDEIPEKINIPKEFINKKGEVIIILHEETQGRKDKLLKDFYGTIPDFPERPMQGEYEKREIL